MNVDPQAVAQAIHTATKASEAAAAASGWTPGAVGVWTGVTMGAAYLARNLLPFRKAQDEREAALHASMADINTKLQLRIDQLEDDIREERRRCDEELAEQRKRYETEMRSLNDKYDAIQRMLIQFQISTGRVLELGADKAPASEAAIKRLAERAGEKIDDRA